MTANQISFYKAKNEKEHYDRMDKESKRHNKATEVLNQSELDIKDWYNKASIAKDYANIDMLTYHYAQSDEAALSNARSNAINASSTRDKTQLELAKEYGYAYVDEVNGNLFVAPEPWTTGPISYQIGKEELKQQKVESSLKAFSGISSSLGSLGRFIGPITQAIIKVMN